MNTLLRPSPTAAPEIRALATRDSLAQLTLLINRAYAPLAALGMNLNAATQDEARTRARTLSGQTYVAICGYKLVATVTVCHPMEVIPGSSADAVAHYKDPSTCRFHQFALDPDYRGQGLARMLLRQAEDWARERGYAAMAVDMAEGATELCAFYRHMGYRVVSSMRWPGKTYLSLVFRKDLHQSPLRAPLLTMARLHQWATDRLLSALEPLSEADYRQPMGLEFGNLHATLSHMLAAERELWWPRFDAGVSPELAAVRELESERLELARRLRYSAERWQGLIEAMTHDRLDGQLRYRRSELEPENLTMAEALLHVFNQASHHRGEICAALALLGQPPPPLGLVVMLQEEAQRG